jgi:phosphotransferase system, enzyme I, PtsP
MSTPAVTGAARLILRKLREIMSGGDNAQARLDRLVTMIASAMVADVCSIYLKRGTIHELFATEGLKKDAVHRTKLKENEGLVGLVAETARPLNIADAPNHPRFAYRPETGEDPYNAFLGVPIVRSERVFGVLVVQNKQPRLYADEEVEALQMVAMVLEEMVASGNFGDLSGLQEVEVRPSRPERLVGRGFADGIAIGRAVLHEPHAPLGRMIADDPAREEQRLDEALERVRAQADALVQHDPGRLSGQSREVLEVLRDMARDRSWEERLKRGVRSGLSADAAVANARAEHRARAAAIRDPYQRERMQDVEDLDNRLLRALAAEAGATRPALPEDAVLIARDIGAAELLEYGVAHLKGVALEEGGSSSHAAIIARALGIPMVGRIAHLSSRLEAGDRIVLDGERGEVRLRPEPEVVIAYEQRQELRSAEAKDFALHRDDPAVTKDGRSITLLLNAGLMLDVQHLADAGAQGVGLFRTEFQFMVSEQLPRVQAQVKLYSDVLDAVGDKQVTFRTLDVGGDKVLPYVQHEREENPALGWRAIRIALDREALMRAQVRALVEAAEGRWLRVMFPLVTMPAEFDQARALVEKEVALARQKGREGPRKLEVGAMIEAPAIAFAIPFLKGRADFLSIGTNDLMQYFFAADRGNPRVSERYDILCAPALQFLDMIRRAASEAGIPLSICGEAAGRPLEAMAFIALGYDRLSMPAAGVGPVKRMLRGLDAGAARREVERLLASPATSVRADLTQWAKSAGVAL